MIPRVLKIRFSDSRYQTIWLTVYSDLITNLMLVFLALFGLTMLGDEALRTALLSMNLKDLKAIQEDAPPLSELEKLTIDLEQQFKHYSDVLVDGDFAAVRIRFGENVLFASGKADLKTSADGALFAIADHLKSMPYTVVVEGHTDSIPVGKNSPFRSNWELSLARAMSVVRLLTETGKLAPEQLAAAAYGFQRPRATNLTESGRRTNRRVEIALFREFPYKVPGDAEVKNAAF